MHKLFLRANDTKIDITFHLIDKENTPLFSCYQTADLCENIEALKRRKKSVQLMYTKCIKSKFITTLLHFHLTTVSIYILHNL